MSTDHVPDCSADDTDGFCFRAAPEQPLSEAVVVAIATQQGHDDPIAVAGEFGPLYDAIDPDALDAMFESTAAAERSDGSVAFPYADRRITVDASGRVEIRPLES